MKRQGFSLIELLTVITIIGILTSLVVIVLAYNLTNARIQATKSTIKQLNSIIAERAERVGKLTVRGPASQFAYNYREVEPPANTPPVLPLEIAELIVQKDYHRRALPQRLADLYGMDQVVGTPDDDRLLRKWNQKLAQINPSTGLPYSANHRPETENAELLYLVLTEGSVFGRAESIDSINPNHIQDTDGDSLPEFVDDWGNQLRFYNCPTRLFRPGGETSTPPNVPIVNSNVQSQLFNATAGILARVQAPTGTLPFDAYGNPINVDPQNFTGSLSAVQNETGLMRAPYRVSFYAGGVKRFDQFGNVINFIRTDTHPAVTETAWHTLDTYHTPLIVSAGPDGILGLFEPTHAGPERLGQPITPPDDLTDDITNRQ